MLYNPSVPSYSLLADIFFLKNIKNDIFINLPDIFSYFSLAKLFQKISKNIK